MLGAISYTPLVQVRLGPFAVSPHGLGIAIGFLAGARLMLTATRRLGISDDRVYSLLTRAALGAVVGARLAFVLNHPGDYSSPLDAVLIWKGGLSLLGGFAGAIAAALPYMRRTGLSVWTVMDAAAPGMALGVVVGRVGDLVVGDHLGTPTSFVLGYRCPADPAATASPCLAPVVHQTALYDLLSTLLLLVVLLRLRRGHRFDGFVILVFGAWYGVARGLEDLLREDLRRFGLTGSQWTSLATVGLCLWWLAIVRRTPRWGRWGTLANPEGAMSGSTDRRGVHGQGDRGGGE